MSRWLVYGAILFVLVSLIRVLTGANDLDSSGTLRAALMAAVPIALAGLGGIWSERAGVVNIGLEGMMIMGTLGAGWMGYNYGVVAGLVGAMLFGAMGGLVHAIATVTFGVDHIVSGVAINIVAAGLAAFLAKAFFTGLPGGGPTQSPPLPKTWTLPLGFVDDPLQRLESTHWFLLADAAGVLGALVDRISIVTVLALVLVGFTAWVLWKTAFGLRLRSVGESPSAAETLGVNVYLFKYIGVTVSGVFAGLGGAYLAMVAQSGYQNGQTLGLGYIGLAAMIFGNWRPVGTLVAALLFGYTQGIHLRGSDDSLHSLLLLVAILLAAFAVTRFRRQENRAAVLTGLGAALFLVWFLSTDSVPSNFTGMAPYVTTLLVLTFAAQSLRMPAADGQIYRKGSAG
jgi:simple sugar transport system permease protein